MIPSSSKLVSQFQSIVENTVVDMGTPINPDEEKCIEIIRDGRENGGTYLTSAMVKEDELCTPQIMAKLVAHGRIVIKGISSSLRIADQNYYLTADKNFYLTMTEKVKLEEREDPYYVKIDNALPDSIFDPTTEYSWWSIQRVRKIDKFVLRYIDRRPVLVLYGFRSLSSHIFAGIEPYIRNLIIPSTEKIYDPEPDFSYGKDNFDHRTLWK